MLSTFYTNCNYCHYGVHDINSNINLLKLHKLNSAG